MRWTLQWLRFRCVVVPVECQYTDDSPRVFRQGASATARRIGEGGLEGDGQGEDCRDAGSAGGGDEQDQSKVTIPEEKGRLSH